MTREEMKAFLDAVVYLRNHVKDNVSVNAQSAYPEWKGESEYVTNDKVRWNDALYKCLKSHKAQEDWQPGLPGTESLWAVINEINKGSKDDPIPYNGNMVLEQGKYYTQDGTMYLCNRDTGNPVYHPLSALVGLYVQRIES